MRILVRIDYRISSVKRIWDFTVLTQQSADIGQIASTSSTQLRHYIPRNAKARAKHKSHIEKHDYLVPIRAKENTRISTGVLFTVEETQVASSYQSRPMPLKASKGHLKAGQYPFACAFGPTPQEIQSPEQRRPSMRRVFVCLGLNHLGLMWRSQACELLPASSTCARKLWRRCSSTRIWVPPLTFSRRGGRTTSSRRRKPT